MASHTAAPATPRAADDPATLARVAASFPQLQIRPVHNDAEFIKENVSWVHCDIAGTSWRTDATASGIESNGGTGVAVRSIVHFLCENG